MTPLGEAQPDDSFYVAFNAFHEMVVWTLPAIEVEVAWRLIIDTASDDNIGDGGPVFRPGDAYEVQPRSLVLFIRHLEPEAEAARRRLADGMAGTSAGGVRCWVMCGSTRPAPTD